MRILCQKMQMYALKVEIKILDKPIKYNFIFYNFYANENYKLFASHFI